MCRGKGEEETKGKAGSYEKSFAEGLPKGKENGSY